MPYAPGLLGALADLLLPPVCLACDGPIAAADSARLICRVCRARLRSLPQPACDRCGAPRRATGRDAHEGCADCRDWPAQLSAARCACILFPPADRIVHQLKYRGWPALAEPMAHIMAAVRLPSRMRGAEICVPVPTTAARLRSRGYNQADLLARAFAKHTGRRVCGALSRDGNAGTQTTLQPVARRANVAGAFRVRASDTAALQGASVLIVDDVLTTGATASACAIRLHDAGVRDIGLITFARAIDARRLTQSNGAHDDDS